ncbi:hypothetical protein MKX01_024207 [Papaver californicum]|nr:hypothetical protein MKX01_024207 [Papaver californicum]
MAQFNFKKIRVVPNGEEFINIKLSCTQRQTPTIIRKGYAINHIRQFYMRKVKCTQTNFQEKLSSIIDDFPRLDDIHPFYEDLLHVLYNKDHYKLVLGQINSARSLINKIAKDYLKLLKHGDSLYRYKSLKTYLELIRQHMARLPSIDPNTKTVLICGYPNVGKSSFINKITRADVDVQPYAFTTKSLFVEHTDYKCLRYEVIDTPGVLDRSFEDRNIIEMCSITALAHLILFFLDISGSCGYTIAQQAALFHSNKSLFMNKPLTIVCNKSDLQPLDGPSEEDMKLVMEMKDEATKPMVGEGGEPSGDANVLLTMSTLTEDGVISVKNAACEKLLNQRVELKLNSKKINDCLNRFHVAIPKPRDQKERPNCIPQSVLECEAKEAAEIEEKKLERDLENKNGGAGVYTDNLKTRYILEHDEWKEDLMPEILDGHNSVHDFVEVDILQRLEELEQEEGLRLEHKEIDEDFEMNYGKEMIPEEQATLSEFRKQKRLLMEQHTMKNNTAENNPIVPALGLNPPLAIKLATSRSLSKVQKRDRSRGLDDGGDAMDIENHAEKNCGFKNATQKIKALKLARNSSKKRYKQSRVGEADGSLLILDPSTYSQGSAPMEKPTDAETIKVVNTSHLRLLHYP